MDVITDVSQRYKLADKDNKRQFFEWFALRTGLVQTVHQEPLYEDWSLKRVTLDVYGREFTIEVTNNDFPDGYCIALEEIPEARDIFEQHMNDADEDLCKFMVSEFD